MNYNYGKSRDWYHVYALVDSSNNKPRYFGETTMHPIGRAGRHIGESWGIDKGRFRNGLKHKWIRGLASKGKVPVVREIFKSENRKKALDIEAALIHQYFDKITNHKKRSKISKTLINQANRYVEKCFPKLNENYTDLEQQYPGIKEISNER